LPGANVVPAVDPSGSVTPRPPTALWWIAAATGLQTPTAGSKQQKAGLPRRWSETVANSWRSAAHRDWRVSSPGTAPFPVTCLQRVIKASCAACRGSVNSLAEQNPSQETPAKLQAAAAAASAKAQKKKKKNSSAGHEDPEFWP
ncbi:Hypothetical predicted protein, partial [Marmota monax]